MTPEDDGEEELYESIRKTNSVTASSPAHLLSKSVKPDNKPIYISILPQGSFFGDY